MSSHAQQSLSLGGDAIPRTIDLEPTDWLWARYRAPEAWVRPQPRKFQREKCLERLASEGGVRKLGITPYITPQEASFWLGVCYISATRKEFRETLSYLESHDVTTPPQYEQVRTFLGDSMRFADPSLSPSMVAVVLYQLEPVDVLRIFYDVLLSADLLDAPSFDMVLNAMFWSLWNHILPYCTPAAIDELGARFEEAFRSGMETIRAPSFLRLAGMLGMATSLDGVLATLDEQAVPVPAEALLGLREPDAVLKAFRKRSAAVFERSDQVRGLLAICEFAALDTIREAVLTAETKSRAECFFRPLCRVVAMETVPTMLELARGDRLADGATEWLEKHEQVTQAGLLHEVRTHGPRREEAFQYWEYLKALGQDQDLRSAVDLLEGDERYDILGRVYWEEFQCTGPVPLWLAECLSEVPEVPLPPEIDVPTLPLVTETDLTPAQARVLLKQLKVSPPEEPHAAVLIARDHLPSPTLAKTAAGLLQRVRELPHESWLMTASTFWADDGGLVAISRRLKNGCEAKDRTTIDAAAVVLAHSDRFRGFELLAECIRCGLPDAVAESVEALAREAGARNGLDPWEVEDMLTPVPQDDAIDGAVTAIEDRWEREFAIFRRRMHPDHLTWCLSHHPTLARVAKDAVWQVLLPNGEAGRSCHLAEGNLVTVNGDPVTLAQGSSLRLLHPAVTEQVVLDAWKSRLFRVGSALLHRQLGATLPNEAAMQSEPRSVELDTLIFWASDLFGEKNTLYDGQSIQIRVPAYETTLLVRHKDYLEETTSGLLAIEPVVAEDGGAPGFVHPVLAYELEMLIRRLIGQPIGSPER